MNEEARRLFEETENKIQQAIKRQRRNTIILLVAQYLIAIAVGFAAYLYFK